MIDVEREFIGLFVTCEATSEKQLITRLIGDKGLRIGLDGTRGKHLLVPRDAPFKADTQSRGVHLVEQQLIHEGRTRLYADLRCLDPRLDMVFDRLVQDVVDQVEHSAKPPFAVCRDVLEQWRDLLRRGDHLTTEGVVGLIGELEVLRRLAQLDPVAALDAWIGPRRTVHDFVSGDRAIEVKSAASLEGTSVSIHGLDQLDPVGLQALYLAVVHCRPSDSAPTLDERLDSLITNGVPRVPLLKAVEQAGYLYESRPAVSTQFRIAKMTMWHVGPGFPGLRRTALPETMRRGVSNVRYTLSTDSAPTPLTEVEADTLIGGWFASD